MLLKAAITLENCQPDSEKGITYTTISKWPKLTEVVTYLSSQSNAFLRPCIMVSIKINASFLAASKNLSVTSWKAEIYSVYSTPSKPSCSRAEWELTTKRSEFKKWTDRFTQDWLDGDHRWSWHLGDYCKLATLTKGMIIWFPALWTKYSLLAITWHRDQVRQTHFACYLPW